MLTLRLAWRLARGQSARIWLLIACIALGVCARVCVGSFSSALDRALTREARPLLGADLEIASNQPLTKEQEGDLAGILPADARTALQVRFTTMALAEDNGRARTVEVRAVDPGHPLYGTVLVAPGRLDELFGSTPVVFVQQELLDQLDVEVGAVLRLGAEGFRVAGVITDEPGLGANLFALGPRVLIARARLPDTGLDGGGARLRHARLIAIDPAAVAQVVGDLRTRWKLDERMNTGFGGRVENEQGVALRTAAQASGSAARIYDRVGDFLRVIALAALLLGGIGVASLMRGFLSESRDTVAVLQVLGATPGRVLRVFLWQSALVGLAGGVTGAVAGVALQNLLLVLGGSLLPVAAEFGIDLSAMAWGILLGFGASVGFAALALMAVHGIRPAAVLRDEAAAGGGWRTWVVGLVLLGVALVVAGYEARSWRTGPLMVGALTLGATFTALLCWPTLYLPSLIARVLARGAFGVRHGLRNLTRPGFRPLAAVVAIAAAAQLLGAMATYRASLVADIAQGADGQRPGWFCIGLESDQVADFIVAVRSDTGVEPLMSPMVTARLKGINGAEPQGGVDSTREAERDRIMRSREHRLSWRDDLGPDEVIVAGRWMDPKSEVVEASVEKRFADNIGARLGDVLTLNVQGRLIKATVTSIRSVRWLNLRPNFFILLSPHVLNVEELPKTWIAAVPKPSDGRGAGLVATLATRFPNVTTFDIGELGGKLGVVIERISVAVRFLGWFCISAGLLVLIGIGIGTGRQRRGDAALLAVLGGTGRTLLASITAEFAALGTIAAVCGLGFGVVHASLVLVAGLDLNLVVPWSELALIALGIVVIGVLSGLAACRSVFTTRPLVVLRES